MILKKPFKMVNKYPLVKEYMTTPVLTINNNMSIYNVIDFLINNHISGAPVVDEQNRMVGIISEKDCLKLMSKGIDHHLPKEKDGVENFMTKDVIHIGPHFNIFYVAGIFLKNYYRRLPVVENEKLIGQISRVDILRAMRDYLKERDIF